MPNSPMHWALAAMATVLIAIALALPKMIRQSVNSDLTEGIYTDAEGAGTNCQLVCYNSCVANKVLATAGASCLFLVLIYDIVVPYSDRCCADSAANGGKWRPWIRTVLLGLSVLANIVVLSIIANYTTHPGSCSERVGDVQLDFGFWMYVVGTAVEAVFLALSVRS